MSRYRVSMTGSRGPGDPGVLRSPATVRWVGEERDRYWTRNRTNICPGCRLSFGARSREGVSGGASGI